jgi:hypothetical protein
MVMTAPFKMVMKGGERKSELRVGDERSNVQSPNVCSEASLIVAHSAGRPWPPGDTLAQAPRSATSTGRPASGLRTPAGRAGGRATGR